MVKTWDRPNVSLLKVVYRHFTDVSRFGFINKDVLLLKLATFLQG